MLHYVSEKEHCNIHKLKIENNDFCMMSQLSRKLATLKKVFISIFIFFSTQTSSTGRLALPFALASYLSPMHSLAALLYFTAGPADHMGTVGDNLSPFSFRKYYIKQTLISRFSLFQSGRGGAGYAHQINRLVPTYIWKISAGSALKKIAVRADEQKL